MSHIKKGFSLLLWLLVAQAWAQDADTHGDQSNKLDWGVQDNTLDACHKREDALKSRVRDLEKKIAQLETNSPSPHTSPAAKAILYKCEKQTRAEGTWLRTKRTEWKFVGYVTLENIPDAADFVRYINCQQIVQ